VGSGWMAGAGAGSVTGATGEVELSSYAAFRIPWRWQARRRAADRESPPPGTP